ncbi:MAG: hypothetical protein RLZZ502_1119 [Pseudomonadota bacterium]|jgi:hypothetical protein
MKKEAEIYCPEQQCGWRPGLTAKWDCIPSCGTVFNTFLSRGTCPGCGYQWTRTQCLSCGEINLHERWYHYPPEDDLPSEEQRIEDLANA